MLAIPRLAALTACWAWSAQAAGWPAALRAGLPARYPGIPPALLAKVGSIAWDKPTAEQALAPIIRRLSAQDLSAEALSSDSLPQRERERLVGEALLAQVESSSRRARDILVDSANELLDARALSADAEDAAALLSHGGLYLDAELVEKLERLLPLLARQAKAAQEAELSDALQDQARRLSGGLARDESSVPEKTRALGRGPSPHLRPSKPAPLEPLSARARRSLHEAASELSPWIMREALRGSDPDGGPPALDPAVAQERIQRWAAIQEVSLLGAAEEGAPSDQVLAEALSRLGFIEDVERLARSEASAGRGRARPRGPASRALEIIQGWGAHRLKRLEMVRRHAPLPNGPAPLREILSLLRRLEPLISLHIERVAVTGYQQLDQMSRWSRVSELAFLALQPGGPSRSLVAERLKALHGLALARSYRDWVQAGGVQPPEELEQRLKAAEALLNALAAAQGL